jgi:nitrogen-specific signal transduction histidine kinase
MNTPEHSNITADNDFLLREWIKRNWNNRLMDLVNDGVYIIDKDGNIIQSNSTFTNLWEFIHGEWQPNLFSPCMILDDHFMVKMCHQSIAEGSGGGRTLRRFRSPDGTYRCFDVTESPIRSGERLWGIIGIVRERSGEESGSRLIPQTSSLQDSEERERLEHALRSSLGLIRGYAYALDKYPDLDQDKQRKYIGYIREEADRLSRWLDNALETPQLEQEVLSSLEQVSLVEIIRATTQDIGRYAHRRGIKFEENLPKFLPQILASREAISRIVGNLLDNAMSLSLPEGIITVVAQDAGEGVEVAITESKTGTDHLKLPEEKPEFKNSIDQSDSKIGVSLSVAKRLTESLGGKIGIVNGPGKTTTFKVLFPKMRELQHTENTHINEISIK